MNIVTKYVAYDGEEFLCEASCLRHEEDLDNLEEANTMLREGKNLFECLKKTFARWEYKWEDTLDNELKTFLQEVNKDSSFVVRHWQCSEKPGYKPCEIKLHGKVFLYGDAGSWSGCYGGDCTLTDLMRYAKNTPSMTHLFPAQTD